MEGTNAMNLIKFSEVNVIIAKNQSEYLPMPAYIADDEYGTTTICWKLTIKERIKLLITGKIWHQILTFKKAMQPQILSVTKLI